MKFNFVNMENKHAKEVLNWHYEGEYSFYDMDFDKEDLEEFLDCLKNEAWNDKYAVLDEFGDLIGIFSYYFIDEKMEIGLGLRPDLTGKGLGKPFIERGILFGRDEFNYHDEIKLRVASFNKRARRLYEHIGFREAGKNVYTINNDRYEFINMVLKKQG